MKKYQTRTQLLLHILLEEAEEDLQLSEQRIEVLTKVNDTESLEIEREFYHMTSLKIEKIRGLIEFEMNSNSSVPSVIHFGFINSKGEILVDDVYTSDLI